MSDIGGRFKVKQGGSHKWYSWSYAYGDAFGGEFLKGPMLEQVKETVVLMYGQGSFTVCWDSGH